MAIYIKAVMYCESKHVFFSQFLSTCPWQHEPTGTVPRKRPEQPGNFEWQHVLPLQSQTLLQQDQKFWEQG